MIKCINRLINKLKIRNEVLYIQVKNIDRKYVCTLFDRYTQYPIIRNSDKVPLVGFLKNSPISDSQRFLIIQV